MRAKISPVHRIDSRSIGPMRSLFEMPASGGMKKYLLLDTQRSPLVAGTRAHGQNVSEWVKVPETEGWKWNEHSAQVML